MRPHFLESSGGTGIGYGMPFRGIIQTVHDVEVGRDVYGTIATVTGHSSIYTTSVRALQRLGSAPEKDIYLIETRNSVYIVEQVRG